jgi:coatomer subunit beta'
VRLQVLSGMTKLAKLAADNGRTNVAFVAYLLTGNVEACADLLVATHRLPEAAFFVRTYLPSRLDEVVALWKTDLASVSETAAKALATPSENADLFPDLSIALQVEQMFLSQREGTKATGIPATDYMTAKDDLDLNLIQLIKQRDQPQPSPEEIAAAEAAAAAQAEAVAAAAAAAEEQARLEAEAAAAAQAEAEAQAAAEAAAQAQPAQKMEDSGNDFGDDW